MVAENRAGFRRTPVKQFGASPMVRDINSGFSHMRGHNLPGLKRILEYNGIPQRGMSLRQDTSGIAPPIADVPYGPNGPARPTNPIPPPPGTPPGAPPIMASNMPEILRQLQQFKSLGGNMQTGQNMPQQGRPMSILEMLIGRPLS